MLVVLTQGAAVAGRGIPNVVEEPSGVVHPDCILLLAPQQAEDVGWVAVWIQADLHRAVVVHPWEHILFPWKLLHFHLVLRSSFHACWIQEIQVVAVVGWTMAVAVLHAFTTMRRRVPSVGSTSRSTRQYKHSIDPLSTSFRPSVSPSLAFTPVSSRASHLLHVCLPFVRCDASNRTKDRCFRSLPAFFSRTNIREHRRCRRHRDVFHRFRSLSHVVFTIHASSFAILAAPAPEEGGGCGGGGAMPQHDRRFVSCLVGWANGGAPPNDTTKEEIHVPPAIHTMACQPTKDADIGGCKHQHDAHTNKARREMDGVCETQNEETKRVVCVCRVRRKVERVCGEWRERWRKKTNDGHRGKHGSQTSGRWDTNKGCG